MNVVLVYNPNSGSRSSLEELRKLFDEATIEVIDSIKIEAGFESSLKPYIQQGKIIAVVGGDGSISAVANLLVNTKAVLMPLPGGTLNHFTKDLGIPQSLPEALAYFKSARKTNIDTGQVEGRTFINNSSIGIYSDSLVDRDEREKKYGKWPAAIVSAFAVLFRFRTYHVELNGRIYTTPLIFVGNNRYEPNAFAFLRTRFDEGLLSVYMVVGTSRLNLLSAAIYLALGKKNVSKKLKSFSTETLTISTHRAIRVSRDGEHERASSPVKYTIQKSSLPILRQQG
jgi:diacylglycerol kinase family enzyme